MRAEGAAPTRSRAEVREGLRGARRGAQPAGTGARRWTELGVEPAWEMQVPSLVMVVLYLSFLTRGLTGRRSVYRGGSAVVPTLPRPPNICGRTFRAPQTSPNLPPPASVGPGAVSAARLRCPVCPVSGPSAGAGGRRPHGERCAGCAPACAAQPQSRSGSRGGKAEDLTLPGRISDRDINLRHPGIQREWVSCPVMELSPSREERRTAQPPGKAWWALG